MESLNYDQLLQQVGNGTGEVNPEIRESIIENASRIITSRQARATSIEEAKTRIDASARQIIPLIGFTKANITKVVSGDKCNEIVEICDIIIRDLKEYQNNIDALHRRIHDGKIRVAAIGYTGVGKSEFHKKYTRTINEAFPQNAANMQDSTGTVVTVRTSNGRETSFEIALFDEEELVKPVNWYIREIRKEYRDWTANGYYEFSKISEIQRCRGNVTFPSGIRPDLKNGLGQYFSQTSDGDWINDLFDQKEIVFEGQRIPIQRKMDGCRYILTTRADLAHKFMLMSQPCKYFLATKEVRVCAKVENGDVLSCFEIVDTKGLSTEAGSYVSEEIKDAITECDAVVSICKDDQHYINRFHGDVLGSYRGDHVFKQKHFAIINLFDPNNRADNEPIAIRELKDQDTTEKAYLGSVKDDSMFSDYVIVDLLDSITEVVSKLDTERIKKCNKTKESIMKNINALGTAINNLNLGDLDEYSIIRNRVEELINAARITINVYRGKAGSKTKKNNNIDVPSLVYAKIAGKQPERKLQDTNRAIEEAVKDRYHDLGFDSQHPFEHKIGVFIQETAAKFNDVVYKAMYSLSEQEVCLDPLKKEILDKLWKDLMLEEIYEGKGYSWASEEVSQANDFFKDLSDIYKREDTAAPIEAPKMFDSYKILYNYFTSGDNEIEPNENKVPEINHKLLIKVLKEAFEDCDIAQKINEREDNMEGIPMQAVVLVEDKFKIGDNIEKSCMDFYTQNKNIILDREDKDNIERNRFWHELKQNIESIRKITIGELPEEG